MVEVAAPIPYGGGMPKRSSKPRDTNALAKAIVDQSTDPEDQGDDPYEGKNKTNVVVRAVATGASPSGRRFAQGLGVRVLEVPV
jgi:hypothetical protein